MTERSVGLSKSCYYYTASLTAGDAYEIDWRDSSTPTKIATEALSDTDTWIDAAISSRSSWSDTSEDSYTYAEIMRLISATLFGKATGGGTSSIVFRDLGDTKDRVTESVDPEGNRSTVVLDGN